MRIAGGSASHLTALLLGACGAMPADSSEWEDDSALRSLSYEGTYIYHRVADADMGTLDSLYRLCLETGQEELTGCELRNLPNSRDPVDDKRFQQHTLIQMILFSTDSPEECVKKLLPKLSYGALEILYENLSGASWPGLINLMHCHEYKVSRQTQDKIRDNMQAHLKAVRALLYKETSEIAATPVRAYLKLNQQPLKPYDVLMFLLRRDTKPGISILQELSDVLEYAFDGEGLAERIKNFVMPLMDMVVVLPNANTQHVIHCKELLLRRLVRLDQLAIVEEFEWSGFQQAPMPDVAAITQVALENNANPLVAANIMLACCPKDDIILPDATIDALSVCFRPKAESPAEPSWLDTTIAESKRKLMNRLPAALLYIIVRACSTACTDDSRKAPCLADYINMLEKANYTSLLTLALKRNAFELIDMLEKYRPLPQTVSDEILGVTLGTDWWN
ncbi:hypothetical protein PAPHI01_1111 [Pancytospora philotis]|nr:hypothetical protein PAPHI01_1111 [Pancytospora philotis]